MSRRSGQNDNGCGERERESTHNLGNISLNIPYVHVWRYTTAHDTRDGRRGVDLTTLVARTKLDNNFRSLSRDGFGETMRPSACCTSCSIASSFLLPFAQHARLSRCYEPFYYFAIYFFLCYSPISSFFAKC